MPSGTGDLDGQVDGETKGVVKLKGNIARKHSALGKRGQGLVQVNAAVVERRGGIDHRPVPGFGNQHPASQPDVPMADVLGRGPDVGETLQRQASGSVPKSFGMFFRKKFNSGADFSGRKLWK